MNPSETYRRQCLILKVLETGTHINWARRRIDRVVHFVLSKYPNFNVNCNDWRLVPFGFFSRTIQSDVDDLLKRGLLSIEWLPSGVGKLALTDPGRYHVGAAASQEFGQTNEALLQGVVQQLVNESATIPKSEYVNKRVFRASDLQTPVCELRKQDAIEDSEFGVGYIVVHGFWIPTEIIKTSQIIIQILE